MGEVSSGHVNSWEGLCE